MIARLMSPLPRSLARPGRLVVHESRARVLVWVACSRYAKRRAVVLPVVAQSYRRSAEPLVSGRSPSAHREIAVCSGLIASP